MPANNVLKGRDNEIIEAMNEPGMTPYKVAMKLGVYPNSIRNWMKNHGYQAVVVRKCVKTEPARDSITFPQGRLPFGGDSDHAA